MKKPLAIAFLFLALPLFADWGAHGLTPVSTGPSSLEGGTKYLLKDAKGRTFYVNSLKEPDDKVITQIVAYKDEFYNWKQVRTRELSFYLYEKGIQAVLVPSSISHRGTDLKPYLPAGFTFIVDKDTLRYRYRIIVGTTSLKLSGVYGGEEPLLDELLAYVKGIKEKKIIVEDEKVISGSVVSFTREKKKGEQQVHPVGDLPFYDKATGKIDAWGKFKIYAAVQGSYLLPVDFLGDIFIGGYGFSASVGLCDLGFTILNRELFKFDIEFMAGYWNLNERKQKDDYEDCSIRNAYVVPLGLTARYHTGIMNNLYLSPSLGFGMYYNKLEYSKLYPNGTVECVSVREWNPALTVGLRCDYRFKKFCVFAGPDFMLMFERRLNLATLMFNAGGGYRF